MSETSKVATKYVSLLLFFWQKMHKSVFIVEDLLRNEGFRGGLSDALLEVMVRSYFVLSRVSFKELVKVE